MFLDYKFPKKNYSYLSEADDDENNSHDNEPTEGDAEMDLDKANDEESSSQGNDDGESGEDDGMGGEDGGDMEGMDNGEGGEDDGMGGEDGGDDESNLETKSKPEEGMKKKKLLKDYRNLVSLYDDTINALSFIEYSKLTANEKKIFNYIEQKIKENEENIDIVVKDQYEVISYDRLLKLYMYFKLSLKTFADIVKEFYKE